MQCSFGGRVLNYLAFKLLQDYQLFNCCTIIQFYYLSSQFQQITVSQKCIHFVYDSKKLVAYSCVQYHHILKEYTHNASFILCTICTCSLLIYHIAYLQLLSFFLSSLTRRFSILSAFSKNQIWTLQIIVYLFTLFLISDVII